MRELTPAEARVIAGLLGAAAATERERLKRIAVPRSTYHAARRRAYAEGWLRDRYVPQPERIGFPWAVTVAARPFVDRADEVTKRWAGDASCVYLAAGPELALGVFLHRDEASARRTATELANPSSNSWRQVTIANLHRPSVPVYFDYEGLWSHLAGAEGTVAYPRGLGGSPEPEEAAHLTDHQKWAVRELLHRAFDSASSGRAGHLVGPLGLPFSQQRLVAQGVVLHRVFLDPGSLPSFRGHAADQMVLVSGAWKPGARPEALFRTLTQECRVYPFLYVLDGERAMLGALGRSVRSDDKAVEPRRPVLPTLQETLQGIELVQVPVGSLRTLVDHRYDRLLPPATPG
ncbi:MAG: hypothetical protein L3K18_00815 [Thermoplasmata archaeon]|nr:hypothetical protein [Thermoplasmata archaeon]MCI4355673.1 hypothetical protein [Thermoplasmata archaeon]